MILDYDVYNINEECAFSVYMCESEDKTRMADPKTTSIASLCMPHRPPTSLFPLKTILISYIVFIVQNACENEGLRAPCPDPSHPGDPAKELDYVSGTFWVLFAIDRDSTLFLLQLWPNPGHFGGPSVLLVISWPLLLGHWLGSSGTRSAGILPVVWSGWLGSHSRPLEWTELLSGHRPELSLRGHEAGQLPGADKEF